MKLANATQTKSLRKVAGRLRIRLGKARAEQNESALPRAADISADTAGSRRRAIIGLRRPLQPLIDFLAQQSEVDWLGQQPGRPEFGRFLFVASSP